MYDFIQAALTATIEAIALVTFIGLPAHYIITSHVREVRSWGNPYAISAQEVKPEVKAVVTLTPEAEVVSEVTPVVEAVKEALKVTTASSPCRTRSKEAHQPKLQPMPVGAAVMDYSQITSEQLRKECTLQGVNWRTGGDYGKPMKKGQMLIALR